VKFLPMPGNRAYDRRRVNFWVHWKPLFKTLAAGVARNTLTRRLVNHLVYPTVVERLREEVLPDTASASGLVEAFAWKAHAYLVWNEELRPTGLDCCEGRMRLDHETRTRLLEAAVAAVAGIDGDIVECGVYQGDSIRLLAERCPERRVYGFDSFEGLPEPWWTRPRGMFAATAPRLDLPNVTLVQGLFEDSLPKFLPTWTGRAALVHVDCDLYSSTRACLLSMLPRCQVGTVIVFDEYWNYPDFAQHEWRAWRESRVEFRITAPCIAYDGRRAAFQITELSA
jgi:hypothetical protein